MPTHGTSGNDAATRWGVVRPPPRTPGEVSRNGLGASTSTLGALLDLSVESQGTGPSALNDANILAEVSYGPEHCRLGDDSRILGVGLPPLAAPMRELWRTSTPVHRGWQGEVGFATASGVLFAHVLVEGEWVADPIKATHLAYTRLLDLASTLGCPHPLRVWNFLSDIHERNAALNRYQAFCIGRERALREAGLSPEQFPAATAVGSLAPGLLVCLFGGSRRGIPVENPRQISAYRYPLRYGPSPPSFARALNYSASRTTRCFVSGTASVVGHQSLHPEELGPQLKETLANLDAILDKSEAGGPTFLKVFLRRAEHLDQIEAPLRNWAPPGTPILYLRADVCREELEIEIECVCGR